jgi:hypothetical protein
MEVETTAVLAPANELATATIETAPAKSDSDLALEALLRGGSL